MAKVQPSIQIQTPTAALLDRALPDSDRETDDPKSSATGFQTSGSPSSGPQSLGVSHGLFKWVGRVHEIKEAIERTMSSQEKAESHAANGEFEEALKIGLEMKGLSVEFDLKLVEWAKRSRDLLLARDILHEGGHGASFRDAREKDAYLDLHQNPADWLAAAEFHRERGDYLKAIEHAEYALFLSQNTAHAGPARSRDGAFWQISFLSKSGEKRPLESDIRDYSQALFREMDSLEARLENLRWRKEIEARSLKGSRGAAAAGEAEGLTEISGQVKFLNELKPERVDLTKLIREAKVKIVSGALLENRRLYGEGFNIARELEIYSLLEPSVISQDNVLDGMTVANSRFALELDERGIRGKPGPFEIRPEDELKKRSDLPIYRKLKQDGDPLASEWEVIAHHRQETALFRGERCFDRNDPSLNFCPLGDYDPLRDGKMIGTYREKPVSTLQDLARLNRRLERRNEIFSRLAEKVNAKGKEETKDDWNPAIEALSKIPSSLEDELNAKTPLPEAVLGTRDFLIECGKDYDRYFSEKKAALLKRHETYRLDEDYDGVGKTTRQLDRLKIEWTSLEGPLARLREIARVGTKEETDRAIEVLKETTPLIQAAKERQVRSLLQDGLETLPEFLDDEIAASWKNGDFSAGNQSIRKALESTKTPALSEKAVVDARVEEYREIRRLVEERAQMADIDRIIGTLGSQKRTWTLAEGFRGNWVSDHDAFAPLIQGYRQAKALLKSSDPADRERGRNLVSLLQDASLVHGAERDFLSASRFTGYAITPLKILVAGTLAAATGKFLGPLLGKYVDGELWANAATFTVSDHVLTGAMDGRPLEALAEIFTHPGATLRETVSTAGMLKFSGLVNGLAMKGAARLGWKGFKVLATRFAADVASFNAYEIPNAVFFDNEVHSFSDLKRVAGHATSWETAWQNGVLTLSLMGGGSLTGHGTEWLVERAEGFSLKIRGIDPKLIQLNRTANHMAEATAHVVNNGGMNIPKALDAMENSLLEKEKYLRDLPQASREQTSKAEFEENAQALANVRQFREAYNKSLFKLWHEGKANPYGLAHEKGDLYSYSGPRGNALLKALRSEPSVTDIRISQTGFIDVQMKDPLGHPAAMRLYDRTYNADVPAMKRFLQTPLAVSWQGTY